MLQKKKKKGKNKTKQNKTKQNKTQKQKQKTWLDMGLKEAWSNFFPYFVSCYGILLL